MVRLRFVTTDWAEMAPSWAAPAVALLSVVSIALFVLEPQLLREPSLRRLRARGQAPEQVSALLGLVLMLSPVSWAPFGSMIGLPVRQFVSYAGLSFVGLAYWGWRYRRVIYAV